MKAIENISTALLSLILAVAAPLYAQEHADKQGHPQEAKHEQSKPAQRHAQPQAQEKKQPAQHAERQPRQENKQPQHAQKQETSQSKPSPQHAQTHAQQHAQQRQAPEKQHSAQRAEKSQPKQQQQHAHAQPEQRSDHARQPSQHAEERGHESSRRTPDQQRIQHTAWHQHGSQHWESDHRTWQQRGGYHGYRIPEDRFRGHFGRDHGFRISGLPFLVVGGFPRFQYQGYWFSEVDPWPESWGDDWYDNDDVYVSYVDSGYYLYNRRYPDVGIAINISR